MKKYLYIVIGFLIWGAAFLIWEASFANKQSYISMEPPVNIDITTLTGVNGAVEQSLILNKYTLLLFGYTSCPDVCPTALITIKRELKRLRELGASLDNVQVLFIGVDPDRDKVSELQKFLSFFDKKIIGLTASHAALGKFSQSLFTNYTREDHGNHIDITHSSRFYIINPYGQWIGSYKPPFIKDQISNDFKAFIESMN